MQWVLRRCFWRRAAAVLVALLVCAACGADAPDSCADGSCPRDASADGAAADAASPDAAPPDAGTEPVHSECDSPADCTLPEGLLGCVSCEDGSMQCPEVTCENHFCATLSIPCPEQARACDDHPDCAGQRCGFRCQGDGRSACFRSRCQEGSCALLRSSCGLQLEPSCPPETRAGTVCAACSATGGCEFEVLGCFQVCESEADCLAGEPCSDGICLPMPPCQ